MRVFVYFNLHKHLWSVKALEGPEKGRVIAHRDVLTLVNPTPKVSEKGRQRVLQERRKNVHAGVVGEWEPDWQGIEGIDLTEACAEVTYNPYKYKTFVYKGQPNWEWEGGKMALLDASARSVVSFGDDFLQVAVNNRHSGLLYDVWE